MLVPIKRRPLKVAAKDQDVNPAPFERADVPVIAVVIVNYRTPELVIEALQSVADSRAPETALTAMIIDNASGDASAEIIGSAVAAPGFADWVTFVPQAVNGGFGWGNNQAVLHLAQRASTPDFVLFLNPDAVLRPGALARLHRTFAVHPECGVVGASLLDADGTAGNFAFREPTVGREFIRASRLARLGRLVGIEGTQIEAAGEADWVTGAAFMARWTTLAQAGLFDDGYFLYFEEIELMRRIRAAGWTVRYEPDAHVLHRAGSSTGVDWDLGLLPPYWHRSRRRYFVQALGDAGADRADRAYRRGRVFARLRGRWSEEAEENVRRMTRAARLPLAPSGIATIGDAPGRQPAWMQVP